MVGRIILVTGGARSGKSSFAEELLQGKTDVCYLATGVRLHADSEWEERIRLHQERRHTSWQTHEGYSDLADWMRDHPFENYLLDSATMLTTNQLFEQVKRRFSDKIDLEDERFLTRQEQSLLAEILEEEWKKILWVVKETHTNLVIVTDEIGLGVIPETRLGRFFRDLHGNINQLLAKEASQVYLVVCGLAQRIK